MAGRYISPKPTPEKNTISESETQQSDILFDHCNITCMVGVRHWTRRYKCKQMEPAVANRSVYNNGCKQHRRNCPQILCAYVQCGLGLSLRNRKTNPEDPFAASRMPKPETTSRRVLISTFTKSRQWKELISSLLTSGPAFACLISPWCTNLPTRRKWWWGRRCFRRRWTGSRRRTPGYFQLSSPLCSRTCWRVRSRWDLQSKRDLQTKKTDWKKKTTWLLVYPMLPWECKL